jgi:small subunit ribosomal protein S1
VVKNLTDYGAFIDLGGIDGLLHITDMSYGRINHPSELFTVGDQVEVVVLKFDRDSERVSLGYKQLAPDPWESAAERYPVGSRVKGKVVSLTDYGAFIELETGVEGETLSRPWSFKWTPLSVVSVWG